MNAKQREALYRAECMKAAAAGRGLYPICNLCDLSIEPGQAWEESHDRHSPRAWGGRVVACGHVRCNRLHGSQIVTPAVAKGKRIWRKHHGVTRPGMGPRRMPGGKGDRLKKKMTGEVVLRDDYR